MAHHRPEADATRPELPLPETAVLWAMRAWVIGGRRNRRVAPYIGPVFAELGAPEAASLLYELMHAITYWACRTLAVHCPCYPAVSEDEQTLLDVLALTQERQGFERLLLLRTLVRPGAATLVGQGASGLVRELNRAGLFLTACYLPVRQHALAPAASHPGFAGPRR